MAADLVRLADRRAALERLANATSYRPQRQLPSSAWLDDGRVDVLPPRMGRPQVVVLRDDRGDGLWFVGVGKSPSGPFVVGFASASKCASEGM